MFVKAAVIAAAVGTAVAQTPSNSTPCDYYTTALLKDNTAANQKTLLTLVVNTAVIGNYTKDPAPKNAVPGILTAGEFNGTAVNLLPYFDGGLASSNRGGMSGVAVNFLDGGGAAPLMNNTAATDMNSNQYMLLTHLYEYFGGLLGCSTLGTSDAFPAYDGQSSMYSVHKFMDLSNAEFGYFVQQVALSAASFGVAEQDIAAVGKALYGAFGYNMSPAAAVVTKDEQLQAICIGEGCPVAAMPVSSGYAAVSEPATATSSLVPAMSSATGSATAPAAATATSSGAMSSGTEKPSGSKTSGASGASASPTQTGGAVAKGMNAAAVLAGVAAFIL